MVAEGLGDLADTNIATHILNNDFVFPLTSNRVMVDLLHEAASLLLEFDELPPVDYNTPPQEFTDFRMTPHEKALL